MPLLFQHQAEAHLSQQDISLSQEELLKNREYNRIEYKTVFTTIGSEG